MEGLKLGETEQQYYAELFQTCDVEGSGKITGPKASDLFRASGLNPEILRQITELCGAKRLGHFGRSQFYIALKLVAIAQAGLPIKLDALNPGKEISLPKFDQQAVSDRKKSCGEPDGVGTESLGSTNKPNPQISGQLPPPPKKSHIRSLSGHYRAQGPEASTASTTVAPSLPGAAVPLVVAASAAQVGNATGESTHNSASPPLSPPLSPSSQKQLVKQHTSPAIMMANTGRAGDHVDGPRTVRSNSSVVVDDKSHVNPVALEEDDGGMPSVQQAAGEVGVVQPAPSQHEQHQQGHHHKQQHRHSQENGNWAMFEDEESHMLIGSGVKQHYNNLEPPNFDSSSISSEAESVDDVWSISEEQREYYVKQFMTMQPDLNNVITGPVAKHFFEKSKLPVIELSKIWQLSDLNCDGALSMEEFCIAMHLVVLRRNEIELPDRLPLSLMPYSTLANDEPFAADLPPGSTLKRATPPSPQNSSQWTAFVPESPGSSGVPSPANLANFEFAKPSADPDLKIVQPVAVRMSPDVLPMQSEGIDRGRAFSDSAVPHDYGDTQEGETTPPPGKQRANTTANDCQELVDSSQNDTPNSKYNTPIQGRPRPVPPKKHSSVPVITRGQLQPPPGVGPEGIQESGSSTEPSHAPPTPPPRPHPARSMSVDVKSGSQLIAPAVPPRVSPKEAQCAVKPGDMGSSAPLSGPAASLLELRHFSPRSIRKSIAQSHRRTLSLGVVRLGSAQAPSVDTPSDLTQNTSGGVEKDLMEDDDMTDSSAAITERLQPKPTLCLRQGSRDRREIHMAVRTHKERNAMLTRLNSELNQELQEVMEQRIALEIQLEHLRPFSS